MFIVIGILLFLAWIAACFFWAIGHLLTWALFLLAILFIIIHFILAFRRRSTGKDEPGKSQI